MMIMLKHINSCIAVDLHNLHKLCTYMTSNNLTLLCSSQNKAMERYKRAYSNTVVPAM